MINRCQSIAIAALAAVSGCLYTGEGTQGLPCNLDADCGAQSCIENVCGGPASDESGGSEESGSGGSEDADLPTPQEFPEACEPGSQQCTGSNSIEICNDEGQLLHLWCEAVCGMGNPVDTGCLEDSWEGQDTCWCASSNGTPSATCGGSCSTNSDCEGGEACIDFASGRACGPTQCYGCFDNDQGCSWFEHSCKFAECG